MDNIFTDVAISVSLAAVLAIIFKLFNQPALLAYILAGVIIGPLNLFHIENHDFFHTLSELGITLLLFLLGLELNISDIKAVGKTAVISASGQISITFILGIILAAVLGYNLASSIYIALAITFSSTILIVKLISDKKEINGLYGKITVGILLIQDFVAIFALIIITGLKNTGGDLFVNLASVGSILITAILLFSVIIYLSQKIIPKIVDLIADSSEVLFIGSIGWALGLAAIISSKYLGLSIEIGGLLAGIALANSIENHHIISKVRSLRDFFVTIFFIDLGLRLSITNIQEILIPIVVFTLFALIIKPLIVMFVLKLEGQQKRIGFMSGLSLGQISEFSLILAFLGLKSGHIDQSVVSLLTMISILTFTFSSYFIAHASKLYDKLAPKLNFFDNKNIKSLKFQIEDKKTNHVVIIGVHKMGEKILENLERKKDHIIVVDYNPRTIHDLSKRGFETVFGDIMDLDIQEQANILEASMIISTIPKLNLNLNLIKSIKASNHKAEIIVSTDENEQVEQLYDAGATTVLQPYAIVGKSIGEIIKRKRKIFTKL